MNSCRIVRTRASESSTGGTKPVFPIEVSNTEFEQNFLTRIELIAIFFPVMVANRSKHLPKKHLYLIVYGKMFLV